MAKLNTLVAGTIYTFSGREWILLNPATGISILKLDSANRPFDSSPANGNVSEYSLTKWSSIAYYLNTTFYNTFTQKEKIMLLSKTWNIGPKNNESLFTVTASVGLLSLSEWQKYNSYIIQYITSNIWLLTGYKYPTTIDGYYTDYYCGTKYGSVGQGTGSTNAHFAVKPVIYANPNLSVINGILVDNSAPTIKAQIPTQSVKKNTSATLNLANYFSDAEGDPLTYTATSSNTNIATAAVSGNTLTLNGKTIGSVTITVTASDGQLTVSQSFTLNVTNTAPTVSVSSPAANMTLYENDTFNVAGSASDVNANQSVTIYAQVNLEQRVVLGVGLSNAAIPFNKQLKFIGGKLFDGETAITSSLIDGVPHTLKIWAQDGDGGQSAITERTFYVVPNRPPVLTVDTVQPNGIINTDKFTISGTAGDPDGNPVTAAYRINGGNSVALEIIEGKWAFDIALAQLVVGQNTIVIELTDSYNFKVSKTIKLNKAEVKTPILDSVARYKIEPPKGSTKGVLLWIQRDEDLTDLTVELSMTLQGEQESYVTLTPSNTAPVSDSTVEDEFYYEADEAKNNIILKLSTSRPDININHKIHLISGVLE